MNAEEDLVKNRRSILDVGQRNQYEAIQGEMRRNNETLTSLRRENKELRLALQQANRGQNNINIDDHYNKEEDILHNKMCVLKRSINAVKGKNTELTSEIDKTKEVNTFVRKEGSSAVDEGSMLAQKIRALENRLDKCLIKHNEVNAIRRTYETLLERLQLEQSGFDIQLNSTEKELQNTQKTLDELTDVGAEAARDRDAAKAEVQRLKGALVDERRSQRKELEQRRRFVQDKRDMLEKKHNALQLKMAQQEERHAKQLLAATGGTTKKRPARSAQSFVALKPDELERLTAQKECYLRLRDATMSHNVTEVIRKIVERSDNHSQLQEEVEKLSTMVEKREAEKKKLQVEWEEVNHRAGGALVAPKVTRSARDEHLAKASGAAESDEDEVAEVADYRLLGDRTHDNRLIVSEFEAHLKQRSDELDEAQSKHEALSQLILAVEAGVQHMAQKLSVVRVDATPITTLARPAANDAKSHRPKKYVPGGHGDNAALAESPTPIADLLRTCGAKVQQMLEELSTEAVAHAAVALEHQHSTTALMPETNVRLPVIASGAAPSHQLYGAGNGNGGSGDGEDNNNNPSMDISVSAAAAARTAARFGGKHGGMNSTNPVSMLDDFPDSEIHDRDELKRMSMATVDREEKKAKKMLMQRRKEETV